MVDGLLVALWAIILTFLKRGGDDNSTKTNLPSGQETGTSDTGSNGDPRYQSLLC